MPIKILTEDKASIIHALAVRALGFDESGALVEVPEGFDFDDVQDALGPLESEMNGAGGLALVMEYLGRLIPDLDSASLDATGTPIAVVLEQQSNHAAELLAALGGEPHARLPHRWVARRGDVELDLPSWIPIEVLHALERIGSALGEPGLVSAWSAPEMAFEVERQAEDGRQARGVLAEVAKLLEVMDLRALGVDAGGPGFDGRVTATAVELARLVFVGRHRSELAELASAQAEVARLEALEVLPSLIKMILDLEDPSACSGEGASLRMVSCFMHACALRALLERHGVDVPPLGEDRRSEICVVMAGGSPLDETEDVGVTDTFVLRGLGRRRVRGEPTTGDARTDALVELYALATGDAQIAVMTRRTTTMWPIAGARVPGLIRELTPADLGGVEVHQELSAIAHGHWSRVPGRFVTEIGPIDVDRLAALLAKLFDVPAAEGSEC